MHTVIFSGGTIHKTSFLLHAIASADYVIAVDQGILRAEEMHLLPHVLIGDLDSARYEVVEKARKKGIEIIAFPNQKDETDTELAILHAVEKGATEITIVGGNDGDRFDHILANILLPIITKVPIRFINGNQSTMLLKGPASIEIQGKRNDLLSLIPITADANGITTENLFYPLTNGTLTFGKARGVSNVFTRQKIQVKFHQGLLFVIHTSV